MKTIRIVSLAAMTLSSLSASAAMAQTAPADATAEAEGATIIVTGTRTTGLKAADSPAPIQVLGSDILKRTGQPDLIQSLAQNLPSIQAQAFGSDLQAHNLQLKLRGLSPNHTLILVNGKRRHGTANVSVAGGPYGGSAAPDISFIPSDSIDHVEVLQDGAAAQYGTDAIAGVINFIQKKADHGGTINLTGGRYYDQGGKTYSVAGNIGLAPFEGAYLNLTAEKKKKGFSFRGDVNPQVYNSPGSPPTAGATAYLAKYPTLPSLPYYPYTNRIEGDPEIAQTSASFNAGYEFGDFEIYSFGSYGHKLARAYENARPPDTIVSAAGAPFYPAGFQPLERLDETDYSITAGFKGMVGETSFDLASTYGHDLNKVYVENSGNAQLYKATGFTPTFFHDGDFVGSQWSNTLDLSHTFDVGLAGELSVAGGLEYRRETYEIKAGDPASYFGGGAQSFFGYSPNDAGFHKRTNFSQYLDLSVKPVENWLVDGAVRHEHYSDFGSTTVFKLTSRYDFSSAVALRGTVSTGFRAPTLAEGFYSGINVGPSSVSGVLPANSPTAAKLGFGGLKPEKSTNFSLGLVLNPLPKLTITLDAYQIQIRNRIIISSSFYGFRGQFCPPGVNNTGCVLYDAANYNLYNQQAVLDAVSGALGGIPSYVTTNNLGTRNIDGSVAVQTFVNGVKMRTRGIDLVATYSSDLSDYGRIDWTLAGNYNTNKVQGISGLPSTLFVHPTDPSKSALISKYDVAQLEHSTPKFRVTAGAFWSWGKFSANLRESYYSKVYAIETTPGNSPLKGADINVPVKSAFITDLEMGYQILEPVKISIGANNLFNKYPTKRSYDNIRGPQLAAGSRTYSANVYPTISPFGINGGYYYARATFKF
jgi:iron complex outermembrane receptor protein